MIRPGLARLDSALKSSDSTVVFRTAYNEGWDHLVNLERTVRTLFDLEGPGMKPKDWEDEGANSVLRMIEKDTALRRFAEQSR